MVLIWCCPSLDDTAIDRLSLQNLKIEAWDLSSFLQVGRKNIMSMMLLAAVLGNKLIVCLEVLAKEFAQP